MLRQLVHSATHAARYRAPVVLAQRRQLHASMRRQAAEDPHSAIAALKDTPMFKQVADKPDALLAIMDFLKLLQSKGVYISVKQCAYTHYST
jgi:hypothetical protein